MPMLHRLGDPNGAGGVVTSPAQSTVSANGLLISVNGSAVSPHEPFIEPHISPVTANGSSIVHCHGIPVNRLGDADTCGHARATGSPNVNIG